MRTWILGEKMAGKAHFRPKSTCAELLSRIPCPQQLENGLLTVLKRWFVGMSTRAYCRGRTTMQTVNYFGMGLLLWILTLAFAASIGEDGTILDIGPLGSILIHCEIVIQRLDQCSYKEQFMRMLNLVHLL